MSENPSYLRNPGVNVTEIDQEIFLVDPDDGEVFYLDEISSALWRFIEEPRDAAEIAATFGAAFPDIPAEKIAADIDSALRELTERGLAVKTA